MFRISRNLFVYYGEVARRNFHEKYLDFRNIQKLSSKAFCNVISKPQELRENIVRLDLVSNCGQGKNNAIFFVSNASKTKGFLMEAMFD